MSDTEKFKKHIIPLQPAMQRMAERLLGNEDDAADAVQDSYVSLWKERQKLNSVDNIEAWCIMMVKRRCVDILRKRRPMLEIDERMDYVEEETREEDRLQLAFRFIDRLPERQARIVKLKHFDNYDTQSIALEMKISEANVYVLLSRAYNNLKQMISEYEKD